MVEVGGSGHMWLGVRMREGLWVGERRVRSSGVGGGRWYEANECVSLNWLF